MTDDKLFKTYAVKVKKTGGDVVLALSKRHALRKWLEKHGDEYLEVD
jgi:hypothetical protein